MVTANQLVAHLVGDYILQSDWMAQEKTKHLWIAALHATLYTLPFLFVTHSGWALGVITTTHMLIDHYRLARYVNWFKNFIGARSYWYPWKDCSGTGYHKDRPAWLAVWLMIFTDNTLHVLINGLAIRYL